jgi:hypothetical protein
MKLIINKKSEMKRRRLITLGAMGILSSCVTDRKFTFHEQSTSIKEVNDIQIVDSYDVIVCGGGPAGIAAAIGAARNGAKTCLIELYGCLGGIWTTGLISSIIDYRNKTGIMAEIVDHLKRSDAQQINASNYDAEAMKLILEQMCSEAGVHIRLYTSVVAAVKKDKRLVSIITESNSGREAWNAHCFIDSTGNGDLAARANCTFEVGNPTNGKTQPMSLMGIICGVYLSDVADNFSYDGSIHAAQHRENLRKEIEKSGFSPSYSIPTLFAIRPDLMALMANHEYGVSAMNAQQLSDATIHARAEVNKIVDGLRSLGGVWKNMRLVATGSQIGIREGRRIKGHYYLTKEDLVNGAKFDDAVCMVTSVADIHSQDHDKKAYTKLEVKAYEIPLRSLIAKDVDGLMMAGRCISGDFFAHASYRMTGSAVAMGEATGIVAAVSAKKKCLPSEIRWSEIADLLPYRKT